MIRVVIADDEPLSRRRLRDLIQEQPDLEIVAEETDGPSTIAAIDSLEPDLVFLDIRMPGATGLEVVDRIHARPWIVFTTAYDRYAVTAFELQALDYLLKPFGPERFLAALDRVREAMGSALEPPLHRAGSALRGNAALERIFVRQRGRIIPVSMERVERLEAQGDYGELHTAVGGTSFPSGSRSSSRASTRRASCESTAATS